MMSNLVLTPVSLAVFKAEAKSFVLTILDSDDDPIDLTGQVLKLIVETLVATSVAVITLLDAKLPESGANKNVVTAGFLTTDTDITAGLYRWRLWNTTNGAILQYGDFTVLDTSE